MDTILYCISMAFGFAILCVALDILTPDDGRDETDYEYDARQY